MTPNDEYLLQIRIVSSILYANNGTINIIVRRPYAYLSKNIEDVFVDQNDVRIKVDKRYGDRRKKPEPVARDIRRCERRQIKETLVDVVISD